MKREELINALKEIKKECEKSKHCDQCKLYDVQELDMDHGIVYNLKGKEIRRVKAV
ncbi:hypothetical protein NPD5_263 [Clostridium sporogenes]|uniref:Uncharacterized protein n=1 Tax=Clostridium sporogenes TaxID=1509 RepID=A0A1J1CX29_CLOSG|nr:hypothetical protein [Clostridium sporogenes]APF26624.1 hypothetical protein NPD7_1250 [Clostridium sporogenes]APH16554.1 hypothetical protein NPD5_263 [Clostridium sporogenes]